MMRQSVWLLLVGVWACYSAGPSRAVAPRATTVRPPEAQPTVVPPVSTAVDPPPAADAGPVEAPAVTDLATRCLEAELRVLRRNPRRPLAPAETVARKASCEAGQGESCVDLAASSFAERACTDHWLQKSCDRGYELGCVSLAWTRPEPEARVTALRKVDHPLARILLDTASTCPDTTCVDQLRGLLSVTHDSARRAVEDVFERTCGERGLGCKDMHSALLARDPSERDDAMRRFCKAHRQVCRRDFRFVNQVTGNPNATALCELGDAEACGYAAMATTVEEDVAPGPGVRGCRLGNPVACAKVSDRLLKQRGVKRITCAQAPEPCASFLNHARRPALEKVGMDLSGLDLVPLAPLAEVPCRRFGAATPCRVLYEASKPSGAAALTMLRRACPANPMATADLQGCMHLGRELSAQGQPTQALRVFRRSCGEKHAESCHELGTRLLDAGGTKNEQEGVVALDTACMGMVAAACHVLAERYRAAGHRQEAESYDTLESTVPDC